MEKSENKLFRNSNIELLRLVLMGFVVLLHFNNATMGGAFALVQNAPEDNAILHFFEAFCICAVNCFMIVSGYFLYTNNKVKFGKVLDILVIVVFYRFFDFCCQLVFWGTPFSIKSLISCFLPTNYFAIFYVVCYILSPFIAKVWTDLTEKDANFFMAALLIVFIVIPTFLDMSADLHVINSVNALSPITTNGNCGGYTIVQFLVMLSLGMWIRRKEFDLSTWLLSVIYAISSIFIMILHKYFLSVYNYSFVLNVVSATSLFLLFKKIKLQNRVINFAAKSCFAIFCIHTSVFSNELWRKYLITEGHFSSGVVVSVIWMIISVIAMFFICLMISFVFRITVGRIKDFVCNKIIVFEVEKNNYE